MSEKLIVITGPTAVGKSDVAVALAQQINGEIIGADSMQIFKKMDVGTGKIPIKERQGIEHHLIDFVDPDVSYSVGKYVEDADRAIAAVHKKGKQPIVVGGTGLYINALLNGHNFCETGATQSCREKYQKQAEAFGNEPLYQQLKQIDPISASKISINDTKRIIRALEIYETTGVRKSDAQKIGGGKYDYQLFICSLPRALLYERINKRVINMIQSGLVEEVKSLLYCRDSQAMQAIGYKEIVQMLEKNQTIEEATEQIQLHSRHYAKRQLTYFRGMPTEKIWIEESDFLQPILLHLHKNQ